MSGSYMFGDFSEDGEVAADQPSSSDTEAGAQVTIYQQAVNAGHQTPNAVRTAVGLPPITPADQPPVNWKRVGRGVYLQTLLQLKQWTDDQLVAAVHAYYPNSRTGVADVKFNASLIARRVGVQPMTLRLKVEQRELLPPPPWDSFLSEGHGNVLSEQSVSAILASLDQGEVASTAPIPLNGARVVGVTVPAPVPSPPVIVPPPPSPPDTPPVTGHEKQPSRFRESVDPNREFDKTSLREASHGQWIHRDYFAHAMRWAHAGRYIDGNTDVLDVGCGPDVQLINILTMPRNQVPKSYVGVDLNREPQRHPNRGWAKLHWEFNFLERWQELGHFDVVTNFEMIEHLHQPDGLRLLAGLRECLRKDGLLLLSTPNYNGKAAATHLHEYTIPELAEAIAKTGLTVERRFGTFANATALRKVASQADLAVLERLHPYYSDEILACVMAPLYPDVARNNIWLLRR